MEVVSSTLDKGCLLITGAYPPLNHSGVFRVAAIGRHLESLGWDLQVVTAADRNSTVDHYPEDDQPPAGRVVRLDWNDLAPRSPVRRWARQALLRLPIISGLIQSNDREKLAARIWAHARTNLRTASLSVVIASSPPTLAALIGQIAARDLKLPLVLDLRDPWTYSIGAVYRSPIDLLIHKRMEERALTDAALVIANTETSRQAMIRDFSLDSDKVVVLPNGYDEASCRASEARVRSQSIARRQFKVVYAGLSSSHVNQRKRGGLLKKLLRLDVEPVATDWTVRSPWYVLEALRRLCEVRPEVSKNLVLQWVGPISEITEKLLSAHRPYFCVDAPGAVSEQMALDYIFAADLLVLLQVGMRRDGKEECTAIPGKLYSYLRAGKPILSIADSAELCDLLRGVPGATHVGARDVDSIVSSLASNFDTWQATTGDWPRTPTSFTRRYDRAQQMDVLNNWLLQLLERCQPTRVGQGMAVVDMNFGQ